MQEELRGFNVVARPLHQDYFNEYLCMFSPTVQQALHLGDSQGEYAYITMQCSKNRGEKSFFYCIFEVVHNHLIGAIEIRNTYERGQLYSWLHESYWGMGFYQEALRVVANAYFAHSGLHYFTVHIDLTNQRSYRALKKYGAADNGFVQGPYGKQYQLIIRKK